MWRALSDYGLLMFAAVRRSSGVHAFVWLSVRLRHPSYATALGSIDHFFLAPTLNTSNAANRRPLEDFLGHVKFRFVHIHSYVQREHHQE